ncbi:M10 family metallopeptidase C-terminal domain-containing protein [Roseovarius sp. LXJ103]|uniref:calcium-binding protein n=1 Tax=Roseovarius carneus TaxID=2853164 RepID=UPI000D6218CB|nr:calcium-binding protein [Roseovarius carneus]MBZ8117410.1 M10 family metallopeptidase C-terminal domain-containing protein [Roseovarius carneus]PWE36780.1 hypothetical protein DD563_12940 [Pelagicola sp. LXJ1103]
MSLQSWNTPSLAHALGGDSRADPDVAVFADGSFVVVFHSDDGAGTERIIAQRFDARGDMAGDAITIAEGTGGVSLAMPDVAILPGFPGQFVVSYALSAPNATLTEAWLSFVDARGGAQQSIISSVMSPIPAGTQVDVAVQGNNVQHVFTAITGADRDITLSTYEWNGFGTSGDVTRTLNSDSTFNQTNPAIALGAGGDGIVVFQQGSDLEFRRIDAQGDPIGVDQVISNTWVPEPGAQVITLSNGNYLVTYTKEVGGPPADGLDTYGRIIAPDGSFVTAEVLLNAQVAGEQSNAFAAALPDGGFVGFYYDATLGTYVGQVFDATASPQGAAYTLVAGVAPGAFLASAEVLSDGRIVVAWEQASGDVAVQILDPRGGLVTGTDAADTLFGGSGADAIRGLSGSDRIDAGEGDDTLVGGAGQDVLIGGAGDDRLVADRDGDRLSGGEGFDHADFSGLGAGIWADLAMGSATQSVWSRADTGQWRRIAEMDGIDAIIGTDFVDRVYGDAGSNHFMMAPDGAAQGMDFFDGRMGQDWADFSQFDTAIWVDLTLSVKEVWTRDGPTVQSGVWREIMDLANVENVVGTAGADHFAGDAQDNSFGYVGGAVPSRAVDIINGRGGTDTADFSRFDAAIWVDMDLSGSAVWTRDGGDVLSGTWRALASLQEVENIIGTRGIDQFYGNAMDNSFSYVSDLTPMPARTPLEIMDGRGGTDTADFSLFGAAIWVSLDLTDKEVWTRLGPTLGTGTWADIVDLVSIERVVGTTFSDQLIGDEGDNIFAGGHGNDMLRGNGGRDSLFGGAGDDRLIGGLGADTFAFIPGDGADVITDFQSGLDTVLLHHTGLGWGDLDLAQSGPDTVVRYGAPSDQITLSGVQVIDLTEADFLFL